MRDTVDNDTIAGRLGHASHAGFDMFRHHAVNALAVNTVHERRRERILHPVDDSDLRHNFLAFPSAAS